MKSPRSIILYRAIHLVIDTRPIIIHRPPPYWLWFYNKTARLSFVDWIGWRFYSNLSLSVRTDGQLLGIAFTLLEGDGGVAILRSVSVEIPAAESKWARKRFIYIVILHRTVKRYYTESFVNYKSLPRLRQLRWNTFEIPKQAYPIRISCQRKRKK